MKKRKNFPFEHDGETLWYSRSMAVSTCVFCVNEDGDMCILINKRGKGAPTAVGKWCIPAGYLDFDEDLCQCGMREVYEETGVTVPRVLMNFNGINSIPNSTNQNVCVMYYAYLPGKTEDYPLSTEHCEPDEVDEVMWLPISMLITSDIELAFNNSNIILDTYNKHIL